MAFNGLQNQLKSNIGENGFGISHLQKTKISSESQQNSDNDMENATYNVEESGKLSDDQNTSQSLSFSEKTDYIIHNQELKPSMHETDDNSSTISSHIRKDSHDSCSNTKDELYWNKGKWRDYLEHEKQQ
jgi:hypothetical protein